MGSRVETRAQAVFRTPSACSVRCEACGTDGLRGGFTAKLFSQRFSLPFSRPLSLLCAPGAASCTVNRAGPGARVRLAQALMERGRPVVLVARDMQELLELRALAGLFSPASVDREDAAAPMWEQGCITLPRHPAERGGKGGWAERTAARYSLRMRLPGRLIVVTADNLLVRLPPVEIFDSHDLRLYKGMEMAPDLILDQAVDWGYRRAPLVGRAGEISVRGDILDIFPPGYAAPLRLEFFGDTLEDMRRFDPASQRSIAGVEEIQILPVAPVIVNKALRAQAEAFHKREAEAGRLDENALYTLNRAMDAGGEGIFSGHFYPDATRLEDWLPKDAAFLLPGAGELAEILESDERALCAHLEASGLPRSLALRPSTDALAFLESRPRAWFEPLRFGVEAEAGEDLAETLFPSFQELFPRPEALDRPWQHLTAAMKAWAAQGGKNAPKGDWSPAEGAVAAHKRGPGAMILCFSAERARTRFLKLAEQEGITPRLRWSPGESGLFALIANVRKGLYLGFENILVLGEDVMQPQPVRGASRPAGAFQGLDRYDTLAEGDFLVHRDYGLAAFGGLHRLNLGGTENDYLLLLYSGDDKLYLPVDRLSSVQRFKGADGIRPAPDRLGGTAWIAGKEKARKAIEKIAEDLVEMYALRKVVKGYRYLPLGEMYREFEASFGFEETPDQARAIDEVLADMEKPEPMDRLVCGDVGFGKTEVALRAAFRAALDGRQAALLCPTTVLAEQHYQTFRSRLAGFPLNVGMLSRFVSKTKQKEVLEAAATGRIDILIGTHRLLSKDVILPNLGLLILDEEQRFGVRHKERLKELRSNVDALTLTATPIPRTLQLSLSGIRELSVIETPPQDRRPVATALIERDDAVLKQVIERELARRGQVFWVYNRVQGLERAAEYVKKLVPDARIGMAHGQMSETALESAMHKFWQGELDVLVCTAIIESGLDFPRANTLIVDQAQLFGLGQLYQLRGRVGRSDRQAFAVFVTPDLNRLADPARERLRIILDMDYLGAGFQVAMEDLRLRGAGNILGESQSGHMNRLGLDLFLEMLEEAVAKLKGRPVQTTVETELSLGIPAFIPESYMADNRERLRYYKSLSSAQSDEARRDLEFEMRDRFGPLPRELETFTAVLGFKAYLSSLGVHKADIYPDRLRLAFGPEARLDPAALVAFVAAKGAAGLPVRLHPPAVLELPLDAAQGHAEALAKSKALLAELERTAHPAAADSLETI